MQSTKDFRDYLVKHSYQDYADAPGVRCSQLKELLKSPWACWMAYHNPDRPKDSTTDSMILGQAVHALVFEPELFGDGFIVANGERKNSNAAKAKIEAQPDAHWLTDSSFEAAQGMASALRSHTFVSKLLKEGGLPERSIYWHDHENNLPCKARMDWIPEGKGWIVDLKTTRADSPWAFGRDAARMGYPMQAVWYMDGLLQVTGNQPKGFAWVTVQNTYPYTVETYSLAFDSDVADEARHQYKLLLKVYANLLQTHGTDTPWPGNNEPRNLSDFLPTHFSNVPDYDKYL